MIEQSTVTSIPSSGVYQRVIEITRRYNQEFSYSSLQSLINNPVDNYFLSAVGRDPKDGAERLDASILSNFYNSFVHSLRGDVKGRLIKLVQKYNPKFQPSELDRLFKKGTNDFFERSTGGISIGDLQNSDKDLINSMYAYLRVSEIDKSKDELVRLTKNYIPDFDLNRLEEEIKSNSFTFAPVAGREDVSDEHMERMINIYSSLTEFPKLNDGGSVYDPFDQPSSNKIEELELSDVDPLEDEQTEFKEGGITGAEKFRKVMTEYSEGQLIHGGTSEKVTDRDTALAIAYSEARDVEPSFGKFNDGGEAKFATQDEKNTEIENLLAINGLDKTKYSQADFQYIVNYDYPNKLQNDLVNKIWGVINKNGFSGFKNKKIQVFNSGNGELLRFIPDTVKRVDVYERETNLFIINHVLFSSKKIKVHKNLNDFDHYYDLSLGVCSGLNTIINENVVNNIKKGGLLVSVVPTKLMDGGAGSTKARSVLNQKFDLIEAFRLPSDVMQGFDLIVLKKK